MKETASRPKPAKPASIDEYHQSLPPPVRGKVDELRRIIRQVAPAATEVISYGMPAFRGRRILVFYAACKEHIGFYPTPSAIAAFKDELAAFKTSKGAIQFPSSKRLPSELIRKIVKFRVAEDGVKAKAGTTNRPVNKDIATYNKARTGEDQVICTALAGEISRVLPEAESKIWHGIPVWFLEGNPIVGYGKLKNCVRLLFWSGQSFDEAGLQPEGSFKAAEVRYTSAGEINSKDLQRWLAKAKRIQWDYKNIIKRKGVLVRLV